MRNRWLIPVVALVSLVLLAGLYLWQRLTGPSSPTHIPSPPRQTQTIDPNRVPLPNTGTDGNALSNLRPGRGDKYAVETVNDRGQLIQFFGDTYEPLPNGEARVTNVLARVYLTPSRIVEIRSAKGTIVAPANHPRSGDLDGNIVLSLFEGRANERISFAADSPDLVLRLYMNQARFDLELGQIDSNSKIHLTHSRFDFRGEGLTLSYNQLKRRIDHLEVFKGESLRIKTSEAAPGSAGNSLGSTRTAPTGRGDKSEIQNLKSEISSDATFYVARLNQNVALRNQEADLAGQALSVFFSLDAQSRPSSSPNKPAAPGDIVAVNPDNRPPAKISADGSLCEPEKTDLVITWSGRFTVDPLERVPEDLAGISDAMLSLTGAADQPVRIQTVREDRITAHTVDFLLSAARVRFLGAPQITIESPQLGVLKAPALVIDQKAGTGVIPGAGVLQGEKTGPAPALADLKPGTVLSTTGLPEGMSVAWGKRLDLTFYQRDPAELSQQALLRLRAIKSASFSGDVKVVHPDMDLGADALAIGLDEPKPGRKQTMTEIAAAGNVRVDTRATSDQPATTIKSDQLAVDLERTAQDKVEPRRLRAIGHVDTLSTGRRLRAGTLEALLGPAPATPAKDAAAARLRLTQITAKDQVVIDVDEPRATLTGAQAVADIASDTLTLIGDAKQPAALAQADGALTSGKIILNQKSQTVEAPGPGVFLFVDRPTDPKAQPVRVTTHWNKGMTFDNKTGQARFLGAVVTDSQTQRDTTRLACEDLRLSFESLDSTTGKTTPANNAAKRAEALRRIKSIAAQQNVAFTSENHLDAGRKQLGTRLTILGPNLVFTNATQAVQVIGPGKMLLEDYRPPEAKPAAPAATGKDKSALDPGIRFAGGRGQTLFTWQGQLTFDASKNDMTIEDTVKMTHQAEGSKDILQMDCQKLVADLESSAGGMNAWVSGSAPTPKLAGVTATGKVLVVAPPRTIRTDKLVFNAKDQAVLLLADPGRFTEIVEQGQKESYSAGGFRWHLKNSMLEIINPGPGRLPVK